MKNNFEIVIIISLVIANVIMLADSLLDYKMDKFLDVNSNNECMYIYKK